MRGKLPGDVAGETGQHSVSVRCVEVCMLGAEKRGQQPQNKVLEQQCATQADPMSPVMHVSGAFLCMLVKRNVWRAGQ